jgi:hypothetical protein
LVMMLKMTTSMMMMVKRILSHLVLDYLIDPLSMSRSVTWMSLRTVTGLVCGWTY